MLVPWNNKTGYKRTMGVQGIVDSGNRTVSWDFPVYGVMLFNDRISHYSFIELKHICDRKLIHMLK